VSRYPPDPRSAFAALRGRTDLQTLSELTGSQPCHLVGGALRDAVTGVQASDLDVVVSGHGRALAEALAEANSTRIIELGGERFSSYRVLTGESQIDLWDRGTDSLVDDLRRRDLTIHSFAMEIHDGSIVDPFGGLDDLAQRSLRMTTPDSFSGDPLRVLRLCRFATHLRGFRIDPATLSQAVLAAPDLHRVASERIRTEVESSLSHARAAKAVKLWITLGILPDALLGHTTEVDLRQQVATDLGTAFAAFDRTTQGLSATEGLVAARVALTLRVLGATVGLASDELGDGLLQRGYLTRDLHGWASRIASTPQPPATRPEQRWYLHSLGRLWATSLAFLEGMHAVEVPTGQASQSLSSQIARLVELVAREGETIFDPPRLVTGRDLQSELGLESGPELGRILAEIRRRQIEGKLGGRQQAVELAKKLITGSP
jgi:tRNA nucleotidyltransferase (CCA-adding enzyme)